MDAVAQIHNDCFAKAVMYKIANELYLHFYSLVRKDQAPNVDDIYKVAKAYDHWSFVHTIDKLKEANSVLEACISLCRAVLQATKTFKEKEHHFNAIERGSFMSVKEINGTTRIKIDNRIKIASQTNAGLYLAWWNVTHPCTTIINQCIQEINAIDQQEEGAVGHLAYDCLQKKISTEIIAQLARQLNSDILTLLAADETRHFTTNSKNGDSRALLP